MKPYYDDGKGIQIYHGDCREILPSLGGADLVLTDPPYGVNLNTSYKSSQRGVLAGANDYPPVYGDDSPFDPNPFLHFKNIVLWGANYFSSRLFDSGQWLIWDKRDGSGFNDQADCELAWTKGTSGTVPRIFRHRWNGMIKDSEQDQKRCHPTQKPISLMSWCLSFFPKVETIIDPYMGAGSSIIAAKNLGRKAIGIEIEEKYCEIAAKRLQQEVLPLTFDEPKPTQEILL